MRSGLRFSDGARRNPLVRRARPRVLSISVLAVASGLVAVLGATDTRAALPTDPAGVPFLTFAHARAAGDAGLACEQLSATVLHSDIGSLGAARRECASALASIDEDLDDEHRHRFAATRVIKVRVKPGRARVTVQTTVFGIEPRATGTAVMEAGQWKIDELPLDFHIGSSYVRDIPSSSMQPTLRAGDTVLVDQAAYRDAKPRIGDIIVFHPPTGADGTGTCGKRPPAGQACAIATRRDSTANFVKRIVAGPGDRVAIRGGHVIRNGRRASEPFITPCGSHGLDCDFPRSFVVPAGRYYVLGDDRGASLDSRAWGPVARRAIVGRVRRLGP